MRQETGYGKWNAWKGTVFMVLFIIPVFPASALADEWPGQNEKHHMVFLISEDPDNYEAHKTIPAFADRLHREHGFKVTVLLGEGDRGAFHFPGLEAISDADLPRSLFPPYCFVTQATHDDQELPWARQTACRKKIVVPTYLT